jgi:hypothetical protein
MNSPRIRDELRDVRRKIDRLLEELDAEGDEPKALPRVMKPAQYAQHRNVSLRTVYRWLELGLPVERRGKITRIPVVDADRWDEAAAIARAAEIDASGGAKR